VSIRKFAINGIKWTGTSQLIRQAIQMVTSLILARLLQPSDFGLMAMALVVIGFLNIFKDVGTSAAIIQKQEISQQLLSSIFWLNIFIGIIIAVIIFIGSPFFALLFNEERLITMFRFFVIPFFSGTLISIQQALLEKKMNFKNLALFEISSVLVGAIIGIYAAYHGKGVWSLVFQTTSSSIVLCLLLWIRPSHWLPSLYFKWDDIRSIRSFSSNLTGFTILNYFVRSADSFIIGRYLGATDLGYYNLAYKVMIAPLMNLTSVISRVMFPLFSTVNNDNLKLRSIYTKITLTIGFFTIPFFACLMIVSHEFVLVLFGNRWLPVAQLLFILSPVGLLQSIDATTGSLYQAKGRTDLMFKWGIFTGILAVMSFFIGVQSGVNGVALSYLAVTVLWTYPGFAIPLSLIEQQTLTYFAKFKMEFFLVFIVCLIAVLVKKIVLNSLGSIEILFIVFGLMFFGYIGLSILFNRNQLNEIKNVLKFNN
jgi:O-antigen/teichoic acid export membrane protein